jgi:predicted nucleotidyltransferase
MNRETTLKTIKEFFKDKPLIEKVYLFGSFLRKEESGQSDIDLLVEMKEIINLLKFIQIKQELELKIQRRVDLLTRESVSPYILPIITKEMELIYERKR